MNDGDPSPCRRLKSEDDIKSYAETTMNELLGWFGYEKVGSGETQALNLNRFQPSPPSSPPPHEQGACVCAWCGKLGLRLFTLRGASGHKAFCSELCFTQCRRASFKRNKICDWCKHIRHTVSYVDFQDGEHQLQFCSDKCLNQYKMNVFCRETRAHLQQMHHPCATTASTSPTLITPDLWMRECAEESDSDPDRRAGSEVESDFSKVERACLEKPPDDFPKKEPVEKEFGNHEEKIHKRNKNKHHRPTKRIRNRTSTNGHYRSKLSPPPTYIPSIHLRNGNTNLVSPPPFLPSKGHPPFLPRFAPPNPFPYPPPPWPPFYQPPPPFHVATSSPMKRRSQNTRFSKDTVSRLPPVTVMVPYPLMIPVPLPIPVPIPITPEVVAAIKRNHSSILGKRKHEPELNEEPEDLSSLSSDCEASPKDLSNRKH